MNIMSIEEIRYKVIDLVIKANASGKYSCSFEIGKYRDQVKVVNLMDYESSYQMFCFRDDCADGMAYYHTEDTIYSKEYMTSQEVFNKFNDFVIGEMN